MPKKAHKADRFEADILAFLDRRKGQPIDDELLGKFATFFWRKKLTFELATMRSMAEALNRQHLTH